MPPERRSSSSVGIASSPARSAPVVQASGAHQPQTTAWVDYRIRSRLPATRHVRVHCIASKDIHDVVIDSNGGAGLGQWWAWLAANRSMRDTIPTR